MNKCKCGGLISDYDSVENIIEDGFLVCKGTCSCSECGKKHTFEDIFSVDWKNPFDTIIEEM